MVYAVIKNHLIRKPRPASFDRQVRMNRSALVSAKGYRVEYCLHPARCRTVQETNHAVYRFFTCSLPSTVNRLRNYTKCGMVESSPSDVFFPWNWTALFVSADDERSVKLLRLKITHLRFRVLLKEIYESNLYLRHSTIRNGRSFHCLDNLTLPD